MGVVRMDPPLILSVLVLILVMLVDLDLARATVCAPATTHTLLVDPTGNGSLTSLEAAIASARALPSPRNVTIRVAAPSGRFQPTLRLRRGLVITAEDSCLRILGDARSNSATASCTADLNRLCSSRLPPHECGVCAGMHQHELRAVGRCTTVEVNTYCAEAGQADHLRMDVAVPSSALRKVDRASGRVQPSAQGHIYQFDLSAIGMQHASPWPDTFTQGDPSTRSLAVFWNGKRLELARSPKATEQILPLPRGCNNGCENKGTCRGGIPMRAALRGTSTAWLSKHDHKTPSAFAVYPSEVPRLQRWASAVEHGLYLLGNWRVDFVVSGARVQSMDLRDPRNSTVQLVKTVPNGIGWKYNKSESGCGCEPFYAINALELITEPLEYAIDAMDQAVYIFLPDLSGNLTVITQDHQEPFLTVESGAHDVVVESLHAGYAFGRGIVVEDGAHQVQVLGCNIHDVGGDALELKSRDTTVRSNDIAHTGGGGIVVNVNDHDAFVALRPSNVTVANNHLYHIGYLGIAYGVGISLVNGSTGVHISHNLIHHVSGKGIHGGHRTSSGARYANQGQFTNLIEYNEIFSAGLNGSGFSAIYSCCGPVDGAGTITRYNFIHSSPGINAIGWDNQLSGQQGYGNVIYFMQNGFGLNHGSFNTMQGNLIVANAPKGGLTSFQADAAISTACRGFSDVYNCSLEQWAPWGEELQQVRIDDPASPWGKKFGWYLQHICDEIATTDGKNQRITGLVASGNALVYIDQAYSNAGCTDDPTQNNTYGPELHLPRNTTINPGFANYASLNFTLLPSSPIFKALPEFRDIPFGQIGLEIDQWRMRLPSDSETGRLDLAPGTPGGPPAAVLTRRV